MFPFFTVVIIHVVVSNITAFSVAVKTKYMAPFAQSSSNKIVRNVLNNTK